MSVTDHPITRSDFDGVFDVDIDAARFWTPDVAPWADTRAAVIAIDDDRMRKLVEHHLAQTGTFGGLTDEVTALCTIHAASAAEIRPRCVYVAEDVTQLFTFAGRMTTVEPVGLVAPQDLGQLPSIVRGVLSGVSCLGSAAAAISNAARTLSVRSLEITQLVAMGYTNAEIAAQLNYSLTTVKRDLAQLFDVFGASSRRELVRAAASAGLIATMPLFGSTG